MSKPTYKAILFHPEGDSVTDFRDSQTKESVWEAIQNMGSRWIFYPLCFVATDKRIVGTPEGLEHLHGKAIATVKKYLAIYWEDNKDEICDVINKGLPLSLVYPS